MSALSVTEILERAGLVTLRPKPDKCMFCKDAAPSVKLVKRDGKTLWLCRECLDACGMGRAVEDRESSMGSGTGSSKGEGR
jgi:ribosomal protein L37AE/L43A